VSVRHYWFKVIDVSAAPEVAGAIPAAGVVHWQKMHTGRTAARIIALLCLAAVMLAALAPGGHGLPVAILAPFWLFLAILVPLAVLFPESSDQAVPASFVAVVPGRAPPTL
jgi:hypothetical protein